MKSKIFIMIGLLASALFFFPAIDENSSKVEAGGPHESVSCLGCHSIHYAVAEKMFGVTNRDAINPRTKTGIDGMSAQLCLGCHNLTEFGGAGVRPIHLHTTHPVGIVPNPRIAKVPNGLLRKGVLDCTSCHEPHPSNNAPLYLRVDIAPEAEKYEDKMKSYQSNPSNIQKFCTACHPNKGDMAVLGIADPLNRKIVSAMDERETGKLVHEGKDVITHNPTPYYYTPLGKFPQNNILPKGTWHKDNVDFVFDPAVDVLKMFEDVKKGEGYQNSSIVDTSQLPPIDKAPMLPGKNRDTDVGYKSAGGDE